MFPVALALMLIHQTPIVVPNEPLTISWNQSPTGAGSARFEGENGTWALNLAGGNFVLVAGDPQPSFVLNTPGGLIPSYGTQAPQAGSIPGFVVTAYTASPFHLEYTCADPRTSTIGWAPSANALVVTITGN